MPDVQPRADVSPSRMYQRGEGVANDEGIGYEYKMALLLWLRANRLMEKFWLGVNVKNAGAFDDLVLLYMQGGQKYKLLVQLKHKSNRNAKIKLDSLKEAKGSFSLNKYFNSIQDDLVNTDRFDLSNFVVFTNAAVEPLQKASKLNPAVEDLLNTGGVKGVMYRVNKDLCNLFKFKAGADKFIDKLAIFCCQADVDELDDLIKQEITLQFRRIPPNMITIFDTLLEEVRVWWLITGESQYLTEDWSMWNNLGPTPSLLSRVRFDKDEIENLFEIFDYPKIHLIYTDVEMQTRTLKVLQALQEQKTIKFFLISIEDILDDPQGSDNKVPLEKKGVISMWQDGKFNLLAVDTHTEPERAGEAGETLSKLINLSDGNRRLLLISDGKLTAQLGGELVSRRDSCIFNRLDAPSKSLVLEGLWAKSSKRTDVLSRDVNGELLSMFLSFENGTASLLADRNGSTPLQLAVENQNLDMVELLLELGSDLTAANKDGDTSLILSCRKPSSEIVKILLEYGALTTVADFVGDSPLIIAVRNGCTDTVKLLLEHGASTKSADRFGCTSLLIASAMGSFEIVNILLKHGAAIRCADMDGNSPLHLAVKSKDERTVKILVDNKATTGAGNIDGDTPLLVAVKDGSTGIVKLLLEKKASTSAATAEGDTALHIAVRNRCPEIVRLFLDHGASTTAADVNGLTPLQIAESCHYEEIIPMFTS